MDRAAARRPLVIAIPIGIAAEFLLDGTAFGINVPIVIALLLSSGWFVRRSDRAPDRLDMWLPIAALLLSVLVAVRADPFVALLDVSAAFVFTGAAQDAAAVRERLEIRRGQLANDPALTTPVAWNLGRERARAALATLP